MLLYLTLFIINCISYTFSASPYLNDRSTLLDSEQCGIVDDFERTQNPLFQFPWLGILMYKTHDTDELINIVSCHGTLISKYYVLTAARCIQTDDSRILYSVRFGEYNRATFEDCVERYCAPPTISVPIETTIVHNRYANCDSKYDVALIRLKYFIPYTEFIRPICLPFSGLYLEKQKWLAGWGITATEFTNHNNVRQIAKVEDKICYPNQICLEKGVTFIGSGVPLISNSSTRWYLSGLLSYSDEDCLNLKGSTHYSEISEQIVDWIYHQLNS